MKTGDVLIGNLGEKKYYTIIQDDSMLVTAYEKDKDSGSLSIRGIPLGKLGHIEDPETQVIILSKLKAHS